PLATLSLYSAFHQRARRNAFRRRDARQQLQAINREFLETAPIDADAARPLNRSNLAMAKHPSQLHKSLGIPCGWPPTAAHARHAWPPFWPMNRPVTGLPRVSPCFNRAAVGLPRNA